MFGYPEVADDRGVRISTVYSMIICILVSIWFQTSAAHYLMLGLMVDFTLRFVGGGNFSPIGAFSNVHVALMDTFGLWHHLAKAALEGRDAPSGWYQ